jgi:hypothetical protein
VGGESNSDMKRLRSQARRLDITIRAQPASSASQPRAYSLIDRATGMVIQANIGLDDLSTRLWWITRDRRRAETGPFQALSEQCPSCGASRIGAFRYCISCGLDYEASLKSPPDQGWWMPRLDANDPFLPGQGRRNPIPRPAAAGRRRRLAESGFAAWHAVRSVPWRELAIAATIGLLIGVMVTMAASR